MISILLFSAVVSAQNYGVAFYHNFKASEYGGHNRSFDIECDSLGHVYVANFEGLLIYDGVNWRMIHTPGISRITSLYKAHDGRIWVGGCNVLGVCYPTADSVEVKFLFGDKIPNKNKTRFGEIELIYERNGEIHFLTDDDMAYIFRHQKVICKGPASTIVELTRLLSNSQNKCKLTIPDRHLTITSQIGEGLKVTAPDGSIISTLTTANGLCSNSITDIAYDGKGTIWGTTDNGIFAVSASPVYSRYGADEGLKGQITCLLENEGNLYVGTLLGLYRLKDNRLHRVEGIGQACWQMVESKQGTLLIATADGIFECKDNILRQITKRHTLSIYVRSDGKFMSGELDGVYLNDLNGNSSILDRNIKNVCKIIRDTGKDKYKYISLDNPDSNVLFSYTDDRNNTWTTREDGSGLTCRDISKNIQKWLTPFDNLSIQAMYVKNGIAWIGGAFGLYRLNMAITSQIAPHLPKAYIRNFSIDNGYLSFAIASDKLDLVGKTMYSYRLKDDDAWSAWNDEQKVASANMAVGDYELTVRVKDANGDIAESPTIRFTIPEPWYWSWYSLLLYLACGMLGVYGLSLWRMSRIRQQNERLEKIVDARTKELKEAHAQLVRKEKEATAGKLTKGLIDRILNPMNYINNFSHLTLGLLKDLSGDIADVTNKDASEDDIQDAIDDAEDIMSMMHQNLEKIEQHGLSTTRILKAMEEMLKERQGKIEPTDIASICQQTTDMLKKYYAEDIKSIGINIEWSKPEYPIVADVNAEQLGNVISSMLSNSIYALKKKNPANPTIRLSIKPPTGTEPPSIVIWDNGIGIEEGSIDKIFDPFFTTKPTAEAPGVGLYLARQIIEDFGGTVGVKSVKNEWTEFTIQLP
ncbi:MAG: hypothetical protein IJQ05_03300 [Bacteroidaceae bacterium]|nr:hypothetical protein [Bacteroidaceae bacterium]